MAVYLVQMSVIDHSETHDCDSIEEAIKEMLSSKELDWGHVDAKKASIVVCKT